METTEEKREVGRAIIRELQRQGYKDPEDLFKSKSKVSKAFRAQLKNLSHGSGSAEVVYVACAILRLDREKWFPNVFKWEYQRPQKKKNSVVDWSEDPTESQKTRLTYIEEKALVPFYVKTFPGAWLVINKERQKEEEEEYRRIEEERKARRDELKEDLWDAFVTIIKTIKTIEEEL